MSDRKDIETEEDVKFMVDSFYDKVNADDLLSPIFNDFSKVNWEAHLPKMYAFWNNLLLGKQGYSGNPFQKHIPLPVEAKHFDRWISTFMENIDQHFSGPTTEDAKLRAKSIAHVFQSKLSQMNQWK